jgi:hypothetical protein
MKRNKMSKVKSDMTRVNELRASTAMSPVNLSAKPPKWLAKKIISVAKTLLPEGRNEHKYFSADYVLQKLLFVLAATEEALAAKNSRNVMCAHDDLYDHPGTTIIDGQECYVLEPYPSDDTAEYEAALNVATRDLSLVLGCAVSWQADSWYYPGYAYRILFRENVEFFD